MLHFILNNTLISTDRSAGMAVLDFIRTEANLTGTKSGCREGDCGACTILVGRLISGQMHYQSMTSCLLPLGHIQGAHVVTIEGLNQLTLNPIQQQIIDQSATQCGFCTPGIIVALTGFFLSSSTLDASEAHRYIEGNICRCTGYASIKRAVNLLPESIKDQIVPTADRIAALIHACILPAYFGDIANRLSALPSPDPQLGDHPIIVGGGTDLMVQRPKEMTDVAIAISGQDFKLTQIIETADYLEMGSAVTMETLKQDTRVTAYFPNISDYLDLVSSKHIRHMATIGGNIVNASPIADVVIMLLAQQADVVLELDNKQRLLPLNQFYLGYKTLALLPGERIRTIRIPSAVKGQSFGFAKLAKRTHLDIASVNVAISIQHSEQTITAARISVGGVAPIPCLLTVLSNTLVGATLSAETVLNVSEMAMQSIQPIHDVRGSIQYKKLACRQLIRTVFHQMFPELIHEERLV